MALAHRRRQRVILRPVPHAQRASRHGAIAGLLLHSAAVLLGWSTWELGQRGLVLTWMDFPSSLLYLGFADGRILLWSLLLGGLQWALVGAVLSYGVGRLAGKTG
jgi:hypothetical protein